MIDHQTNPEGLIVILLPLGSISPNPREASASQNLNKKVMQIQKLLSQALT